MILDDNRISQEGLIDRGGGSRT